MSRKGFNKDEKSKKPLKVIVHNTVKENEFGVGTMKINDGPGFNIVSDCSEKDLIAKAERKEKEVEKIEFTVEKRYMKVNYKH